MVTRFRLVCGRDVGAAPRFWSAGILPARVALPHGRASDTGIYLTVRKVVLLAV
jgi:hypothetical protein